MGVTHSMIPAICLLDAISCFDGQGAACYEPSSIFLSSFALRSNHRLTNEIMARVPLRWSSNEQMEDRSTSRNILFKEA